MNMGIEIEYWVIDEDGFLATAEELTNISEDVEPEFVDPLIEVTTPPCESVAELRGQLTSTLAELLDVASARNRRLVPTGTPLVSNPEEFSVDAKDSTQIQRQLLGSRFQFAKGCAGTHLHFEQAADDASVVRQLDVLTALDPAFALAASASHYRGHYVRSCARPHLYRKRCYSRHPAQGQLWGYVDDVAEWKHRLEESYTAFRQAALARGISRERFERAFDPETAVWNPVRLREEFSTVEWRSPDATLPSEVLRLAEDTSRLIEDATAPATTVSVGAAGRHGPDRINVPPFERLEYLVGKAVDEGAAAPEVMEYLRKFDVEPGESRPLTARIDARDRLSERRARRIRCRCAAELERDVRRLDGRTTLAAPKETARLAPLQE